jgi:hypothetical protein
VSDTNADAILEESLLDYIAECDRETAEMMRTQSGHYAPGYSDQTANHRPWTPERYARRQAARDEKKRGA